MVACVSNAVYLGIAVSTYSLYFLLGEWKSKFSRDLMTPCFVAPTSGVMYTIVIALVILQQPAAATPPHCLLISHQCRDLHRSGGSDLTSLPPDLTSVSLQST